MTKDTHTTTILVSREQLQWKNTDTKLDYHLFIRDPAKQRHFLESAPKSKKIHLDFTSKLCEQQQKTYFGRKFRYSAPDKIIHITLQDALIRHGYRVGRLFEERKQIHHWISKPLGYTTWGLGVLLTSINIGLLATQPEPIQPIQPTIITATISPLFLQRLSELPGAIAELSASPQSGYIHAYIPQDQQEAFVSYINKKQTHMPIHWRHRVPGKTRDAFIWHGTWKQS